MTLTSTARDLAASGLPQALRPSKILHLTDVDYTPLRHARVSGDADVAWVVIGRWMFPNDRTEWTLEYWDAQGQEADRDATFDDESDAKALAAREFRNWRTRLARRPRTADAPVALRRPQPPFLSISKRGREED